jgi:glycosyltransferase involved in cell wall biosynthesis
LCYHEARLSKLLPSIRELGLGERVRFLDNVSDTDLPRLYASGDIFVLPANARAEASGKVLLEADGGCWAGVSEGRIDGI